MFETIRHMLGLCGDGHPSILYILGMGGIYGFKSYLKNLVQGVRIFLRPRD